MLPYNALLSCEWGVLRNGMLTHLIAQDDGFKESSSLAKWGPRPYRNGTFGPASPLSARKNLGAAQDDGFEEGNLSTFTLQLLLQLLNHPLK